MKEETGLNGDLDSHCGLLILLMTPHKEYNITLSPGLYSCGSLIIINNKIVLVALCYVPISNQFNKSKVEEWGGGVYREAN